MEHTPSYSFEQDTQVQAKVRFMYHEFVSADAMTQQLRHYSTTPSPIENPLRYEPYVYDISIESGPYLVGGTKPSSQHRVVECGFYKKAVQAYDQKKTAGYSKEQRLLQPDVLPLSMLGARLGIDRMLALRFSEQKFQVTDASIKEDVDADDEIEELTMRFLLRKDHNHNHLIHKTPNRTVVKPHHLVLPFDTFDSELVDGRRFDAFAVHFPHKNKLLRVEMQPLKRWTPA